MNPEKVISVVELFSGIGGMHAALKETGKKFNISRSCEINPTAIAIYNHNYGHKNKIYECNIMGITTDVFENLSPDLLVMSPPCQPFTRQGLKKDTKDARCFPLLHLISILKSVQRLPNTILLENVAGFETSEARDLFTEVLKLRNYLFQEFLLTPSQFGIPNSRLRYYLIAKQRPSSFSFETSENIHKSCPVCTCFSLESKEKVELNCSHCSKPIHEQIRQIIQKKFSKIINNLQAPRFTNSVPLEDIRFPLSLFLELLDDPSLFLVKKNVLLKYATVFDIVHSSSKGSCCFTKGYGSYVQGTGSVLVHNQKANVDDVFNAIKNIDIIDDKYEELLSSLQLRYFTSREVLRLMCFPESFTIPPSCSIKQAYKVLGNSVNVFVVTILMLLLLE